MGSGNFDYRSFEHNFETNVLIYDKDIAQKIEKFFFGHCKKENLLEKESFKKRSIYFKFMEGLAKFFSPLL
ncbi:phospholipase D-like domain-containing protein [Maribacter sp. 4G9]|uniref:phospholipase D-like domain-containing protein n=1 Tax=Maribacter sp. 4G9 TaxID=1889777 RepID=UPI000C6BA0C3|nr:hypothetical protein BFP75_00005 [Maribacter sp. 4G9]